MAISQRVRNNAGGKLLGSRVLGDEGREGGVEKAATRVQDCSRARKVLLVKRAATIRRMSFDWTCRDIQFLKRQQLPEDARPYQEDHRTGETLSQMANAFEKYMWGNIVP